MTNDPEMMTRDPKFDDPVNVDQWLLSKRWPVHIVYYFVHVFI